MKERRVLTAWDDYLQVHSPSRGNWFRSWHRFSTKVCSAYTVWRCNAWSILWYSS